MDSRMLISGLIASWKDKMVESIGIVTEVTHTLFWFLQLGCFAIEDCGFGPRSFGFTIKMFIISDKMYLIRKKGMQVSSMFFKNWKTKMIEFVKWFACFKRSSLSIVKAGERLYWWTVDELGLITSSFLIHGNIWSSLHWMTSTPTLWHCWPYFIVCYYQL